MTTPVVFAHPQRCIRLLEPGMVKRVFPVGPLHAYQVACPWCGFTTMHFQGEAGFVEAEGAMVVSEGARVKGGPALSFRHPGLVSSKPLTCPHCRVVTVVVDGAWARGDAGSGG